MKTLSLLQPWASLVALGYKTIETRAWSTPYRGRLLIHASLGKAGAVMCDAPLIKQYVPDFSLLPLGAIVGEAILTDVMRVEALPFSETDRQRLTLEEQAFGDYRAGRFAWLLEDAVAYEAPVPAKGKLGLWEW